MNRPPVTPAHLKHRSPPESVEVMQQLITQMEQALTGSSAEQIRTLHTEIVEALAAFKKGAPVTRWVVGPLQREIIATVWEAER